MLFQFSTYGYQNNSTRNKKEHEYHFPYVNQQFICIVENKMKTYRVRARKDAVSDVVVSSVSPVPVRHTDGVKHHGVHRGVLEKDDNEPNVVKLGRT